jgi:hypothetical protein
MLFAEMLRNSYVALKAMKMAYIILKTNDTRSSVIA